jgi:hypothetical protein
MLKNKVGIDKAKLFIQFLNNHRDKFKYIETRLIKVYIPYLVFSFNWEDVNIYIKYAMDMINICYNSGEFTADAINQCEQVIPVLFQMNQLEAANDMCDKSISMIKSGKYNADKHIMILKLKLEVQK